MQALLLLAEVVKHKILISLLLFCIKGSNNGILFCLFSIRSSSVSGLNKLTSSSTVDDIYLTDNTGLCCAYVC